MNLLQFILLIGFLSLYCCASSIKLGFVTAPRTSSQPAISASDCVNYAEEYNNNTLYGIHTHQIDVSTSGSADYQIRDRTYAYFPYINQHSSNYGSKSDNDIILQYFQYCGKAQAPDKWVTRYHDAVGVQTAEDCANHCDKDNDCDAFTIRLVSESWDRTSDSTSQSGYRCITCPIKKYETTSDHVVFQTANTYVSYIRKKVKDVVSDPEISTNQFPNECVFVDPNVYTGHAYPSSTIINGITYNSLGTFDTRIIYKAQAPIILKPLTYPTTAKPGLSCSPTLSCAVACPTGNEIITLASSGVPSCTPCAAGYYDDDLDSMTVCKAWTLTPDDCDTKANQDGQLGQAYTQGTTTSDATCTSCQSGYVAPKSTDKYTDTTCNLCSAGYGAETQDGTQICAVCKDNKYQVHKSSLDTPCAVKECPKGYGTTHSSNTTHPCEPCGQSEYSASNTTGQCEVCDGNRYSADASLSYTSMKAVACVDCPAGKHQNPLHGECEDCPVGKTSNAGGSCDIYIPLCLDSDADNGVVAEINNPIEDNSLCVYINKMVSFGISDWETSTFESVKAIDFRSSNPSATKKEKQNERKTKMRALINKAPPADKIVTIDIKNMDTALTLKRTYSETSKVNVIRPQNIASKSIDDVSETVDIPTFGEQEPVYVPLNSGEGVQVNILQENIKLYKVDSSTVRVKTTGVEVDVTENREQLLTHVNPYIIVRYGSISIEVAIGDCMDLTALNYNPGADYANNTLCQYNMQSDSNIIVQRSDPGQLDETQWQTICPSGQFLHNFGDRLECTDCSKTVFRISYLSDNVVGIADPNLKHYRCCSFLNQVVCMKMLSVYKEACESTVCTALNY